MTGPVGGLAAIAGTEGGGAITMRGSCLGWGTILRGAGEAASGITVGFWVGCGVAGFAAPGAAAGAGGATGTAAGRELAAAAASSLRRKISRIASPGLETC